MCKVLNLQINVFIEIIINYIHIYSIHRPIITGVLYRFIIDWQIMNTFITNCMIILKELHNSFKNSLQMPTLNFSTVKSKLQMTIPKWPETRCVLSQLSFKKFKSRLNLHVDSLWWWVRRLRFRLASFLNATLPGSSASYGYLWTLWMLSLIHI